jgi:CRISPR system Cascade subunit CasE
MSLFLTRVMRSAAFTPRELVTQGQLDPYGQHRLLWRLLQTDGANERTRFLFRAEQGDGGPLFYVLSSWQPSIAEAGWRCDSKPLEPDLRTGDRLAFSLRANPTVARADERGKRSRRHDVVMDAKRQSRLGDGTDVKERRMAKIAWEAGRQWLVERSERLGCRFDLDRLEVGGYAVHRLRRARGITFAALDFGGLLEVTDVARFRACLAAGVGSAKAFGCGLLLLRRVP